MTSLICFFLRGSSSRVVLTAPFSDNIHSKSSHVQEGRGEEGEGRWEEGGEMGGREGRWEEGGGRKGRKEKRGRGGEGEERGRKERREEDK